jgi:hypothetical protein
LEAFRPPKVGRNKELSCNQLRTFHQKANELRQAR